MMVEEEERRAEKAKEKPRELEPFQFVMDHDHLTGLFRGSACNSCNVKAQMPKQIVVFFHNLEGFDGHELVNAIVRMRADDQTAVRDDDDDGSESDGEDKGPKIDPLEPMLQDNYLTGEITLDRKRLGNMAFNVLANSTEKYMEITFGPVVFRDSFKFADSGLANLIKSQRKTGATLAEAFPILAAHHPFALRFPGEASLDLILQKVPMAYTSIVDESYFTMDAILPRAAYFNDLAEEECSEKDYETVGKVVRHFDLKDQGDYHDLYLWTDVLALADCMQTTRAGWRSHCGLDLFKSVTLPSASYQAMLKMTGIRMELLCQDRSGDVELMETLNNNIRGGASCIFQPYAAANNPRILPKLGAPSIPQEQHDRIRRGEAVDWDALRKEYLEYCKEHGYDHDSELSWIIYSDGIPCIRIP